MRKFALAAAAVSVLFAGAAAAADLPVAPPVSYVKAAPVAIYNWGGAYVGINGGWGSARRSWDDVTLGFADGSHDATGGMIGGHIGYRYQATYLVVGVEGQGDWADLSGSHASVLNPGRTIGSRVDGIGLFTAHAGYAWDNVLLYARGGAAVVHNKFDFSGVLNGSVSETRWGGAIGVGLEVGFAPNWSVGVNYDHLFIGTRDVSLVGPAGVIVTTDRVKGDIDMVTARVSYRFGGPAYAKY